MTKPDEPDAVSRLAQAAQSVPPPHAAELREPASRPLSDLHGRTVALLVPAPEGERLLVGVAEYVVSDPDLGPGLRVHVQDEAVMEITIADAGFKNPILPGQAQGCDFLIHLGTPGSSPERNASAQARERKA